MRRSDEGSEVVQFVVAVPLLLLVVFGTAQAGGAMLASSQVSSELTRACRQFDVTGLLMAPDRESFVEEGILGASTQLVPGNLSVRNVRAGVSEDRRQGLLGASAIDQRSSVVSLSYDVEYRVPSIAAFPGMTGQVLSRHVSCSYADGRVVEIGVSGL